MSLKNFWRRLVSGSQLPPRSQDDVVVDAQSFLQPLYFVMHPDNSFSVAEPQPRLAPVEGDLTVAQLQFLLSQAPMLLAPTAASPTYSPFAYVNPTTFKVMSGIAGQPSVLLGATLWVLTSLVPNGCVIYSPNKMPGVECKSRGVSL